MPIKIDENYILQMLVDLVQINSTNPRLSLDGKGEVEIGSYVADSLRDLGLRVTTYEIEQGRVNVVGVLPGTGGGRSLLLNAHMDTVGVEGMIIDPFGADIREGRLYGRGSQDMKGSLAAMIGSVKALMDNGIDIAGDVLVTAVADEEHSSIGTEDLVKHITADAAIVTEPTDLTLCCAHRGFIWYDVETFGRAAHGSRFEEGIDANMRMGRFLARLDQLEKDLRQRPPHPLVGPPSLHAARLEGVQTVVVDEMIASQNSVEISASQFGAEGTLRRIFRTLRKGAGVWTFLYDVAVATMNLAAEATGRTDGHIVHILAFEIFAVRQLVLQEIPHSNQTGRVGHAVNKHRSPALHDLCKFCRCDLIDDLLVELQGFIWMLDGDVHGSSDSHSLQVFRP